MNRDRMLDNSADEQILVSLSNIEHEIALYKKEQNQCVENVQVCT